MLTNLHPNYFDSLFWKNEQKYYQFLYGLSLFYATFLTLLIYYVGYMSIMQEDISAMQLAFILGTGMLLYITILYNKQFENSSNEANFRYRNAIFVNAGAIVTMTCSLEETVEVFENISFDTNFSKVAYSIEQVQSNSNKIRLRFDNENEMIYFKMKYA